MSWEKMSWPSGVVPSRCAALTWANGVKLMLLGSWGSITPGKNGHQREKDKDAQARNGLLVAEEGSQDLPPRRIRGSRKT